MSRYLLAVAHHFMARNVCARCRRAPDRTSDVLWNVEFRGGVPLRMVCPSCEAVEESAEASVNGTLQQYRRGAFGQVEAAPIDTEGDE